MQVSVGATPSCFKDGVPRYWKSAGTRRDNLVTHAPFPKSGARLRSVDLGAEHLHFVCIEAEIALRIGEPIDVIRAALDQPVLVGAICVSIEVLDSRWDACRDTPASAKLADLQCHSFFGTW